MNWTLINDISPKGNYQYTITFLEGIIKISLSKKEGNELTNLLIKRAKLKSNINDIEKKMDKLTEIILRRKNG